MELLFLCEDYNLTEDESLSMLYSNTDKIDFSDETLIKMAIIYIVSNIIINTMKK